MTKQEILENSYGKHWTIAKHYADENGFIDDFVLSFNINGERIAESFPKKSNIIDIDFEIQKIGNLWRPKSLQGIENNNGWIKIETTFDLPKNDIECWLVHNGQEIRGIFTKNIFTCPIGIFGWKTVSHYYPIEKPKSYLY